MKKYEFLSQTFTTLNKYTWWVQNADRSHSSSLVLLRKLDSTASLIENTNDDQKIILLEKAKDYCSKEKNWRDKSKSDLDAKESENERNLFSFFSELMTVDDLKRQNYQNIQFIKKQKDKTPDLSAKKQEESKTIFYIEVKRIQNPRDEDENLRSIRMHEGIINENYSFGIQRKIGDFLCDAKRKFAAVAKENKSEKQKDILVLDFEPGCEARLSMDYDNSTLDKIFKDEYFSVLETVHDMQIWRKKYF